MLAKGLIFLCIGVYATCMPMIKRSPEDADTLMKINEEIQKLLGQIITKLNEVPSQQLQGMCKNLNKISLHRPANKTEEECESFNLRIYTDFFDSVNCSIRSYDTMRESLRYLLSQRSQNKGSGHRCMKKEESTTQFVTALKDLRMFMKEQFLFLNSKLVQ